MPLFSIRGEKKIASMISARTSRVRKCTLADSSLDSGIENLLEIGIRPVVLIPGALNSYFVTAMPYAKSKRLRRKIITTGLCGYLNQTAADLIWEIYINVAGRRSNHIHCARMLASEYGTP